MAHLQRPRAFAGVPRSSPYQFQQIHQSEPEHPSLCIQDVKLGRGRKFRKEDFFVGKIINAALHEEDYARTWPPLPADASGISNASSVTGVTNNSQRPVHERPPGALTYSRFGTIHTKYRPMIIIALFTQHYLAVPLYTHEGAGIEDRGNEQEFVPLEWADLPRSLQQPSTHKALHPARWTGGQGLQPKSAAHFAYSVSRMYRLRVHECGELEPESTDRLVRLYWEHTNAQCERWLDRRPARRASPCCDDYDISL